jgi:hypothetical protein
MTTPNEFLARARERADHATIERQAAAMKVGAAALKQVLHVLQTHQAVVNRWRRAVAERDNQIAALELEVLELRAARTEDIVLARQ